MNIFEKGGRKERRGEGWEEGEGVGESSKLLRGKQPADINRGDQAVGDHISFVSTEPAVGFRSVISYSDVYYAVFHIVTLLYCVYYRSLCGRER